jgi:proteasome assembly chaperone (PAC2) family protein
MVELADLPGDGLFDIEHVEVENGLVRQPQRPRSRFFAWRDPEQKRDLILFIGEAQPPIGKFDFCHRLLDYAVSLGVKQVVTFAAMATRMHPEAVCEVFAAGTTDKLCEQLSTRELKLLTGHIGGLNGILLGAAAQRDMPGICLLGELPHVFSQLAFPKSALPVLEVFQDLVGIDLRLGDLRIQIKDFEEQLHRVLSQENGNGEEQPSEEGDEEPEYPASRDELTSSEVENVERLFQEAKLDRAKAYELKRELDRLQVFTKYENRFLDLFRNESGAS